MTDVIFFEGIPLPRDFHSEESLSFAKNFLVKDDDVIIVTFPRSGTHWMLEIVRLIISIGDGTFVQTVKGPPKFPWIENKVTQKPLMAQDRPSLMASHLPIQVFPKSYFTSRAKIIYVFRNPRDVATSGYLLLNQIPILKNQKTFDEYLHAFSHGGMFYGSWFDHILGWLPRRNTENFLLMSYEELQRDLRGNVRKLCQFLGKHLSPEQLDSVVQNSSFSIMKDYILSNSVTVKNPEDDTTSEIPLLRKGICGDWKNHFTVAQSETFDKVYREKMSSLDPGLFPWSEDC